MSASSQQPTSPAAENANLHTCSTVTQKHTPTFFFLFERKTKIYMASMMAQQVKAHIQQTTEVGSIFGSYGEKEEPAPKSCPLISIPGCPHSLITSPTHT